MKMLVAKEGEFLQTLALHASGLNVVVPHGAAWETIIESDHVFEAMLTRPIERLPIQPLELCET